MSKKSLKKIMMVEDDLDIQTVAKLSLESIGGFDVIQYDSGVSALENACEQQPDLVLLDVMMPIMDGITTFKELKKIPSYKDIPIVFMSAKVQQNDIDEYYSLGAVDVIAKPFEPMKLPQQVLQCLERFHE